MLSYLKYTTLQMNKLLQVVGFSVLLELSFHFLHKLYGYVYADTTASKSSSRQILFFPDRTVVCRNHYTSQFGCTNRDCRNEHNCSSFGTLLKTLADARESIDVCVYAITCPVLTDMIVLAAQRGLAVRVITDSLQTDSLGSQVKKLLSRGIQVRTDKSSFFMHHKFAILDRKTLINGSFNWSKQATTANRENIVISSEPDMVDPFLVEFDKLWKLYDPKTAVDGVI